MIKLASEINMTETSSPYRVAYAHGLPIAGVAFDMVRDMLSTVMKHASLPADIIVTHSMGQKALLLNHPDLIRYVLVENHRNYRKSDPYIRFESAIGLGLLTSNGEKWRRDRQKIQPMFNRERIGHYYFDVVNEVSEKYKQKWLKLSENGSFDTNITEEMARITTEVILKSIFGNAISDQTVEGLYHAYSTMIDYLKNVRIFPKVDLRRCVGAPSYFRFRKAVRYVDAVLSELVDQGRQQALADRQSFLALILQAHQDNPSGFSEKDIRDHAVSMVFAGFESTSILMQWIWYALDDRADIKHALRQHIVSHAPCLAAEESSGLNFEMVQAMDYLDAVIKETMRLYPPFWLTGRQPVEDDVIGGLAVTRGTMVALPQIAMHRHPGWWQEPNSFMPERFMGEAGKAIHPGAYFPFSLGPRKCSGHSFVDMEARTIMAKLMPFFDVAALNKVGNYMQPGISLKLRHPLMVRISRAA